MAKSHEYCTIKKNVSDIIDHLAANVDPAEFAQILCEKELVSEAIVASANVLGFQTPKQRIRPVITAVKSQIQLNASKYHTFVDVLQKVLPGLAETLHKFFTTSLELHVVDSVAGISDWVELAHQLDVDPAKLTELRQCGKREELLMFWAKKDERASWEKLVGALHRMDEPLVAKKIEEKYMDLPPPAPVEEYIAMDLAEEMDALEARYDDLSYGIQAELEEKQTQIKRFRHTLTHLPLEIRHDHYQYIQEHLRDIENIDNIECLFHHLNLYWSFLDYSLLEHIIKRHGSKELKTKMRIYVKDITEFRKKTTLSQLSGYWSERVPLPPHFSQLTIKLDKDPTKCTVDELLLRFKTSLCKDLSLPQYSLVLVRTGEGCLTTVWHIPASLEAHFRITNFQPSFIGRHGILQLKLNQISLFEAQLEEPDFSESEYEIMTANSMAGLTKQIDSKVAERKTKKYLRSTSSNRELLLYIRTLTGKLIKAHCNPTDTAADIKAQLNQKEHIPVEQQRLFRQEIVNFSYESVELENDRALSSMGIKDLDTLFLTHVSQQSEGNVTVVTSNGERIMVPYKATHTVADLKLELQHIADVPIERQQLIFCDKELEDSEPMTAVYNQRESVIKLILLPAPCDEITVKTLEGTTVTLNYASADKPSTLKASDTVESLKTILYDEEGVTPARQVLVFAGKHLEDSQTLGEYNIRGGDVITLAISTKQPQLLSKCDGGKIFIKPPFGRLIPVKVSSADTINVLKARAHQVWDIPMNQQQFLFCGTELQDDQPISSYRVHDGDMLHLRLLPAPATYVPKLLSDCPNHRGQIIVKTQTGEKITLDVEASETVGEVKTKIYNLKEIPVQCQQMIFSGRQLENCLTLENVTNGSTFYLITTLQDAEPMFFVKTLTQSGKLISLEYDPNDTVAAVKTSVEEKEGIPSNQQYLMFAGKWLDDDKTLYDYSIPNGSTLYLIAEVEETLVFVKIPASKQTLTFDHDPDATIASIKVKIHERTQIPLEDQLLVFKGTELEDKHTVGYYGIMPGSTMDLPERVIKDYV